MRLVPVTLLVGACLFWGGVSAAKCQDGYIFSSNERCEAPTIASRLQVDCTPNGVSCQQAEYRSQACFASSSFLAQFPVGVFDDEVHTECQCLNTPTGIPFSPAYSCVNFAAKGIPPLILSVGTLWSVTVHPIYRMHFVMRGAAVGPVFGLGTIKELEVKVLVWNDESSVIVRPPSDPSQPPIEIGYAFKDFSSVIYALLEAHGYLAPANMVYETIMSEEGMIPLSVSAVSEDTQRAPIHRLNAKIMHESRVDLWTAQDRVKGKPSLKFERPEGEEVDSGGGAGGPRGGEGGRKPDFVGRGGGPVSTRMLGESVGGRSAQTPPTWWAGAMGVTGRHQSDKTVQNPHRKGEGGAEGGGRGRPGPGWGAGGPGGGMGGPGGRGGGREGGRRRDAHAATGSRRHLADLLGLSAADQHRSGATAQVFAPVNDPFGVTSESLNATGWSGGDQGRGGGDREGRGGGGERDRPTVSVASAAELRAKYSHIDLIKRLPDEDLPWIERSPFSFRMLRFEVEAPDGDAVAIGVSDDPEMTEGPSSGRRWWRHKPWKKSNRGGGPRHEGGGRGGYGPGGGGGVVIPLSVPPRRPTVPFNASARVPGDVGKGGRPVIHLVPYPKAFNTHPSSSPLPPRGVTETPERRQTPLPPDETPVPPATGDGDEGASEPGRVGGEAEGAGKTPTGAADGGFSQPTHTATPHAVAGSEGMGDDGAAEGKGGGDEGDGDGEEEDDDDAADDDDDDDWDETAWAPINWGPWDRPPPPETGAPSPTDQSAPLPADSKASPTDGALHSESGQFAAPAVLLPLFGLSPTFMAHVAVTAPVGFQLPPSPSKLVAPVVWQTGMVPTRYTGNLSFPPFPTLPLSYGFEGGAPAQPIATAPPHPPHLHRAPAPNVVLSFGPSAPSSSQMPPLSTAGSGVFSNVIHLSPARLWGGEGIRGGTGGKVQIGGQWVRPLEPPGGFVSADGDAARDSGSGGGAGGGGGGGGGDQTDSTKAMKSVSPLPLSTGSAVSVSGKGESPQSPSGGGVMGLAGGTSIQHLPVGASEPVASSAGRVVVGAPMGLPPTRAPAGGSSGDAKPERAVSAAPTGVVEPPGGVSGIAGASLKPQRGLVRPRDPPAESEGAGVNTVGSVGGDGEGAEGDKVAATGDRVPPVLPPPRGSGTDDPHGGASAPPPPPPTDASMGASPPLRVAEPPTTKFEEAGGSADTWNPSLLPFHYPSDDAAASKEGLSRPDGSKVEPLWANPSPPAPWDLNGNGVADVVEVYGADPQGVQEAAAASGGDLSWMVGVIASGLGGAVACCAFATLVVKVVMRDGAVKRDRDSGTNSSPENSSDGDAQNSGSRSSDDDVWESAGTYGASVRGVRGGAAKEGGGGKGRFMGPSRALAASVGGLLKQPDAKRSTGGGHPEAGVQMRPMAPLVGRAVEDDDDDDDEGLPNSPSMGHSGAPSRSQPFSPVLQTPSSSATLMCAAGVAGARGEEVSLALVSPAPIKPLPVTRGSAGLLPSPQSVKGIMGERAARGGTVFDSVNSLEPRGGAPQSPSGSALGASSQNLRGTAVVGNSGTLSSPTRTLSQTLGPRVLGDAHMVGWRGGRAGRGASHGRTGRGQSPGAVDRSVSGGGRGLEGSVMALGGGSGCGSDGDGGEEWGAWGRVLAPGGDRVVDGVGGSVESLPPVSPSASRAASPVANRGISPASAQPPPPQPPLLAANSQTRQVAELPVGRALANDAPSYPRTAHAATLGRGGVSLQPQSGPGGLGRPLGGKSSAPLPLNPTPASAAVGTGAPALGAPGGKPTGLSALDAYRALRDGQSGGCGQSGGGVAPTTSKARTSAGARGKGSLAASTRARLSATGAVGAAASGVGGVPMGGGSTMEGVDVRAYSDSPSPSHCSSTSHTASTCARSVAPSTSNGEAASTARATSAASTTAPSDAQYQRSGHTTPSSVGPSEGRMTLPTHSSARTTSTAGSSTSTPTSGGPLIPVLVGTMGAVGQAMLGGTHGAFPRRAPPLAPPPLSGGMVGGVSQPLREALAARDAEAVAEGGAVGVSPEAGRSSGSVAGSGTGGTPTGVGGAVRRPRGRPPTDKRTAPPPRSRRVQKMNASLQRAHMLGEDGNGTSLGTSHTQSIATGTSYDSRTGASLVSNGTGVVSGPGTSYQSVGTSPGFGGPHSAEAQAAAALVVQQLPTGEKFDFEVLGVPPAERTRVGDALGALPPSDLPDDLAALGDGMAFGAGVDDASHDQTGPSWGSRVPAPLLGGEEWDA